MQQTILDALFGLNKTTTEEEKINYLRNLQLPALEIWNAFRAFPIVVDYRRQDVQSVYMLRYFPPYSQIIKIILSALHHNPGGLPFNGTTVGASFIGCGPSPEIYGFFEFLNSTAFRPEQININTFDFHSDHWAFSRDITFKTLIPNAWPHCPIISNNYNLNIASHNALDNFLLQLKTSNLIVLQNCLNEISETHYANVIQNLKTIISNIPRGAIIAIIDLLGYEPVLDLLADLQDDESITASVDILNNSKLAKKTYDAIQLRDSIPLIVTQNLLTGIPYVLENGLIPKRWIYYHDLVLRKR